MEPKLIKGGLHSDNRGSLKFNNDFDASPVKRLYIISPAVADDSRNWQGHEVEQRWFSALSGSFMVRAVLADDWSKPSRNLMHHEFIMNADSLDILYCPPGTIFKIQALEHGSSLLVLSDYLMGENQDEHRYDADYFN